MRFFIKLAGADKHSAALLTPCGSYPFLYNAERNEHLLEGGALTREHFNEVVEDLIRRWPGNTQYKPVPYVEEAEAKAEHPTPNTQHPTPNALLAERDALRAQVKDYAREMELLQTQFNELAASHKPRRTARAATTS